MLHANRKKNVRDLKAAEGVIILGCKMLCLLLQYSMLVPLDYIYYGSPKRMSTSFDSRCRFANPKRERERRRANLPCCAQKSSYN
jgi:hypothetical protein